MGGDIVAGVARYAAVKEPSTRTSLRAHLLHLLDRVQFTAGKRCVTEVVSADELGRNPSLRGAIQLHLDLVFRTPVTEESLMATAIKGELRVARHPSLPEFPVGVALAMPAAQAVKRVDDLFEEPVPPLEQAALFVLYALATNPPRLGAGSELVRGLLKRCKSLSSEPTLVAFAPLTGLRARLIRLVDDAVAWTKAIPEGANPVVMKVQLLELLAAKELPEDISADVRSLLMKEAREFVSSSSYLAGTFHTSMGSKLVGVAEGADRGDSDALWMRAFFEYPS
jgi:hypothetical protein